MEGTTIDFKFEIEATVDKTWDALVNDIQHWWKNDFYTSLKTKQFVLQAKIGGLMYEDYGDNEGLVWAEVIGIEFRKTLHLKGYLMPDFGGPAISYISIKLSVKEKNTIIEFTDSSFGTVSESSKYQIEQGWRMIYEQSFKNYVENKK